MRISKLFRTEDGIEHSTLEMAEQHILNQSLIRVLEQANHMHAQEILNTLSSQRNQVRQWLDACDAMEKAIAE